MTKRKKSLLFSALIIGVPIVVFLIVNGILVYESDREVEARLDGIRAAGDPVTVADLVTDESVSPEEDAETIVRSARPDCEAICDFVTESFEQQQEDDAWNEMDIRYSFTTWPPPSPDPTIVFKDPIPRLHEAARARVWKHKIAPAESLEEWGERGIEADEANSIRSATRALRLHSEHCLRNGDTETASKDVAALLGLTDKFTEHGSDAVINLLACRMREEAFYRMPEMLESRKVDVETLDRLDSALARIDFERELRRVIVMERACVITHLNSDSGLSRLWLARVLWNRRLLNDLDEMDRILREPMSCRDLEPDVVGEGYAYRTILQTYWFATPGRRLSAEPCGFSLP